MLTPEEEDVIIFENVCEISYKYEHICVSCSFFYVKMYSSSKSLYVFGQSLPSSLIQI